MLALGAFALALLAGAVLIHDTAALAAVVVASGAFLGIANTVMTEGVMVSATVERSIASSAYSFVRFTGGAVAPYLAGKLAEHVSPAAPMYVAAAMVALSLVALVATAPARVAGAVPVPARA